MSNAGLTDDNIQVEKRCVEINNRFMTGQILTISRPTQDASVANLVSLTRSTKCF